MSIRPRLLIIASLLTLILSGTIGQATALASGSWTTVAPAPTKRTEVTAALLNGMIYVIGGFAEPSLSNLPSLTISDKVEVYDPTTNQWSTRASLPVGLHHAAAAVVGNKLYVIGGYRQALLALWHPVATVYMYDPHQDAWTERAPMPTPRGALAVTEFGGRLYALGGFNGTNNIAAVEVYDPVNNTWTTRAPLPTPRDHLAAATVGVISGTASAINPARIYAIGGRVNQNYANNLATVEAYDPAADRWTKVANLPTARSGITAGVIHNIIYVLGGEAPHGTFHTNEAYASDEGRWYSEAPMPTSRHGLGSAVVNERLYVIAGGPKPGGSYTNVNEVFTPPPAAKPPGHATSSQALPKHVGAVMALLATFRDAGVLPPEESTEARQLVQGLIQFQSAFIKSENPAIQQWLREALAGKFGDGDTAVQAFKLTGWMSQSMEAIVEYAAAKPIWEDPVLAEGLQDFNMSHEHFTLLAKTFTEARTNLKAKGQDIHHTFVLRRAQMPGAN